MLNPISKHISKRLAHKFLEILNFTVFQRKDGSGEFDQAKKGGDKQSSFGGLQSRELPDYPSDQQGKHKEYEDDARRRSKNGKKEPSLKY